MSAWYFTRARLRSDAPAAALAPILLPEDRDERVGTAHRLLWTLFADSSNRERDFLWREEGGADLVPGRSSFLILSPRPPHDAHGLFRVETKEFAPALAPGDRLRFALRANPVVTRPGEPGAGGKPKRIRHDVVMDRLHALSAGPQRAEARFQAMQEAGRDWLARQGEERGFRLDQGTLRVDGYDQLRIRRGNGRARMAISTLDMEGVLEVTDPEAFSKALHEGFGKAKAFGCGLMLIRRA